MKLAFDVCYNGNIAQAVCVGFEHWDEAVPKVIYKEFVIGIEAYQPGEFYKRELPCIQKLLHRIDLSRVDVIIIDGYVYLNDDGKPGLGGHLYDSLDGKIPVIGVAKTEYGERMSNIRKVLRGDSAKPLYISSIGMEVIEASENIRSMHGNYRIPTILKKLDQLTKR